MKKRMISIMLAICLVLSLVPTMVFAEENTASVPSVWAYATKAQLMDDTFMPDENGNATNIGKLIFGKNSSGAAQEWYILGTDTKIEGDNTLIFAASAMASNQVFSDNRENYITYDPAWECSSVWEITEVRPDHYGGSALRAALRKMATDNFTAAEQEMLNITPLLYYDEYNTAYYNTYDKLYALKGSGFEGTMLYAGFFFSKPLSMSSYWNSGKTFWLCSPASEFTENHNTGFLASPGGNIVPSSVYSAYAARPASNLNLSSVIFASAAKASNDVASDKIASGTAMTLRLDGSSKNIGTVTYNTTKGNIQAAKGGTPGNVALLVQGNDGTNDWYYSKQITGTETVNVSAIKSALGLSADIDLSKCEIWLETTDNDGMIYAVTVTGCSTEAELRSAIEAGVTSLTLTNNIKLSSTLELSDKIITLDLAGRVLTGDIALIDSSAEPNTILTLIDSDPATGGVLKGNITMTRASGSVDRRYAHLYANGGTITGTVSMSSVAGAIYCTGDTPTAFQGDIGSKGEIHGGIFYGNVTEDCIKEKTVTFMNDGSRYALEVVAGGSKAAAPVEPVKTGYVFLGWFNGDAKYDFTEAVTENITLTAKWVSENASTEDELKEAVALGSPYIRLSDDIKLSSTLDLSDKIITLDLNGHTLTGNIKLADTSAAPQSILTLIDSYYPGGGTVNGNITLTRENYGTASHLYANGGAVTGKVSLDSFIAKIYCTSDTPTAFQGDAVNYGEICGGIFYGGVQNYSTISGGIFYGGIQNISSGSVTEPYHTVSFDLNGGSGSAPTQWFVNAGTAPALKPADPTWDTYGFVGWYNGDAKYDFTEAVTENIELIAKWVLSDVSTESELMEAVNAGATAIKLVGDCTLSSTLDLSDKNITLDLNGHTLTGNIKLEDTSAEPYSILTLIDSNPAEGGVVNGNITLTGGSGYASHLYANGGTITGQVSLLSDACKIFCTSNTPTAFMGYVGDYGEVHGGMFYGDINTGCISEHAVTFMKDGTRYALQVVATGSVAATPVEPAKDGYVYWGWYCFDAEYDFSQTVTSDITLTAKYSDPIVYNISCDLDGGTASNPDSYTVESATITLNNPVKPGYTFTGWSGTGLTGEDNMTVTIPRGSIGDRAYTAHFSQNSYTVIFNSDGGNAISEKTDVKWTDKVLDGIAKPERDDYIFAGWQCGSVTVTEDTTYSQLVADDSVTSVTLVAQWENDSIILQRLVNAGGTVTLDRDYTIAAPVSVTNTVTLDLNGYVIRMIDSDSVIKVSGGGALTMQDSNPTATHTGENASLPVGGVITGGNPSSGGGGVLINRSGFIMEGGTIYHCTASSQGGGVMVANSTFTMNGGTIQECSARRGGGVYADGNSVLTLNGGTIRDCTARSEGGGIYAVCNVTMNDSTIQGCSATDGGGVYIYKISEFTMNGGIIEDCTATDTTYGPGGAVRNHGDFLANGGEIKGTVRVYGTVQTTSSSGDCTVFYDKVMNSGTISGGIYYGVMENHSTISGGIFYGGIQNDVGGGLAVGTVSDTYYTVSFELNGGSGSVPTQWFVNVSTAPALKPTDPTKENCVFTGWYDGDTKYDFTQPVTQDITLTAKWVSSEVSTESELREALDAGITSIKLVGDFSLSSLLDLSDKIITLDLNGHTLTGNIKLADNSVAPKSILTLIDSNPAGGGVVKGNITLTRGSGSVSHLYANGGTITGQVSLPSYAGGIFCTSDTPTVFKGYVGNYGGIYGGIFYGSINESCIKEKTVTFMNGGSRYALEVVADGSKVIEPASHPTKAGYNFAGWYNGETKYTFGSTLSESITLTAEFGDPLNYDISYDLDGGTAANPTTYTVESDTFTLVNPTKTGYTFTGWSGTGLSGNNNMTVTVPKGSTGSRSYTAHWTLDTYTVTLNTNGGTINSGNVTGYTYGQGTALPTDVTKTGYTFAGWYDNAACTGDPVTAISTTATGEKEYWAKWNANQYAVTVESAENGSVSADRNTAAMGDTVTLTVVPETCYAPETLTVTDSNGDGIPVKELGGGKYSFTMPASKVSINAVFAATGHSYSYTDNGNGTHTKTCSLCGDTATETHSFVDGVCVCGAAEVVGPTEDSDLKFVTTAFTMGAELKFVFIMTSATATKYPTTYVDVVVNGADGETTVRYNLEDMVQYGAVYRVEFAGIAAKNMGDSFTATIHAEAADGTQYVGVPKTASIAEQIKTTLRKSTATAAAKTLAVDMLNYGAAAQQYFGYDTAHLVNADLTAEELAYGTQEVPSVANTMRKTGTGTITVVTPSVTLRSKVTLNMLFNTANYSGDISKLSYKVNDAATGEVVFTGKPVQQSGTVYKCVYDDVGAKRMRSEVTIGIYDENDQLVSQVQTWSVESYIADILGRSSTSATARALLENMIKYGDAAAAYLG